MATAGEYEIHHELGRGGMGSVFLAREIGLDRLVAIKVLPPSLMFDEGLIERFQREARMVAKLHHPNIIPVYRVHHSHNLAFYTMHFVPGRSLNELLGRNRVLSLPEVERIMLEAAAGLGYAHKRGVIHRDVKPANILIDAEGHVHLTDFGIAKALVGSTQLTETGAVIGTPQYMAPEQCEGRMVDGRADQYSLAAVGYQLLVGHPPFQSDSMKELLYHHLFTPPRPLNALRPETPLPLRDTIHKALSKDPADRFDSMEDYRMAIEGKGPPIFVSWIDQSGDRRRAPVEATNGPHPYRRSSDPPTTERFAEAPWVGNGFQDELPTLRASGYKRALAGLAVAVLTIAVVAVLAMSQGVGLAGSWGQEQGEEEGAMSLAVNDAEGSVDPAVPASAPIELDAATAMGSLSISGDLPAGARLEVGSNPIDMPQDEWSKIELPTGSHQVVISAAGYASFSAEVIVNANDTTLLSPNLERLPEQPRPQPVTRDTRPSVPRYLLDELDSELERGRILHTIGQYMDAGDVFKEVRRRALSLAEDNYRNSSVLRSRATKAEEDLERARQACRFEDQPNCP
jgi:serine/threonine protein kinase